MSYSEEHFLFSSDPAEGAYNISSDGSRFSVSFNPALRFNQNATRIRLELLECELYYTSPNILNNVNNRLDLSYEDIHGVVRIYNIVIPEGLYTLENLNDEIIRLLGTQGGQTNPPLISFTPNASNSRVIMTLIGNSRVDFSKPSSVGILFGFLPMAYVPYGVVTNDRKSIFEAPNPARLNNINFFVLNCNILLDGLNFNGISRQALGRILINNEPGGQIISTPLHPYSIDITNLKYSSYNNLTFWITSDTDKPISTSEPYSFRLRITTEVE
jgi:hypothetical protein